MMSGSEKQVAWAEDILSNVDGVLENIKLASEAEIFADQREAMIATANKINSMVDSIRDDAKKVIGGRHQLTADYIWKVFVKLMNVDHGYEFNAHRGIVNGEANARR